MPLILVIDDQDYVRDVVRSLLESGGHRVVTAVGGEEGLRAFRQEPADLVLCALFMPNMDGLETVRQLRREFPAAKVVVMTGGSLRGDVGTRAAAEALGAGVVRKPFTLPELREAVEEALRGGG
jgi:CheY-like chemotaxis protein